MEFAFVLMLIAAAVWAVLLVQWHDAVTGTAILIVAASLFPPEYASIELGVSITADRLWIVVLLAQFLYDLASRRSRLRPWSSADLFLALFLAWLILRTVSTPIGQEIPGQPATLMHMVNGYLVPALIYGFLRSMQPNDAAVWRGLIVLLVFGVYLGITALLEVSQQWSWVYPPFIADPKQGIHFGRARGPMLNSVRLGMCFCACLAIVWGVVVGCRPRSRTAWWTAGLLTPLFLAGVYFTYTRSIWLAAGAIALVLVAARLQGRARWVMVGTMVAAASVGAMMVGQSLLAFKREYSAAETLESARMRSAFAYVSLKMFQDRPLAGFGFNQFQVENRPYLDDRTTAIRLESIRGYVHHNSYLSLLVDLGLIGGLLFLVTAAAMMNRVTVLLRHPNTTPMGRSIALVSLCLVVSHAIQMMFHEVSFTSIEYTLLMLGLGLSQAYGDALVEETHRAAGASARLSP